MDRLEAMSVLVAAVDTGSLTAASRRLGMALPSVSRKLADLEAHLGTRLLARTTRRLEPTEAGIAFVQSCRRVLGEVEEAERRAAGEQSVPRGELLATAPIVFGRLHVLPVVNEFLGLYPEIDIRLVLSDRNISLIEDHIDLAVRIGGLSDSSLVAARVGEVRRVVCASPAFLDRHGIPAKPGDLAGLAAVIFEGPGATPAWQFGNGKGGRVAVHPRLSVNTAEAALDAAIAGVGLTRVLSYQAEEPVRRGLLRLVLEAFEPAPQPVSIVHQGQGPVPARLRTFLDFAASRLRQRLAASRD